MLLLPLGIVFAYCAISNAESDSEESIEKHQHSPNSNSGYPKQSNWQQSGGFVPNDNSPQPFKPRYGWYIQPSLQTGSQGYGSPQPQVNFGSPFGQYPTAGGYGYQHFPPQFGPTGYQGQQPPSGYGFPPTGGYNPNVPISPNGLNSGYGPIGQQGAVGYHPHAANNNQHQHSAYFGQQPYGGQQPAFGYNPNAIAQQPLPNFGQQQSPTVSGAHGEQPPGFGAYFSNTINQRPSTTHNGSQDLNSLSTNETPGQQSATGEYSPNALIQ